MEAPFRHAGYIAEGQAVLLDPIDFSRRILTVEGGTAKNRQTRYVPLNDEAIGVLNRWRAQANSGHRIFEVRTGFKTAWAKLLKRANISKFRWHDLRHHFASRLVLSAVLTRAVKMGKLDDNPVRRVDKPGQT